MFRALLPDFHLGFSLKKSTYDNIENRSRSLRCSFPGFLPYGIREGMTKDTKKSNQRFPRKLPGQSCGEVVNIFV
jgi:hypothetical protein